MFPKVDFKFITAKSWSPHKMHQVHLWETHDFTVTILKSTLASLGKVTLLLLTVVTLRLLGVRRHPIVQITSTSPVLSIYHVFRVE